MDKGRRETERKRETEQDRVEGWIKVGKREREREEREVGEDRMKAPGRM